MVNLTNNSQRDSLEQLWIQQTKKPQIIYRIPAYVHQFFQQFILGLITADQPRVWQVIQNGTSRWNAYDPVSQCRVEGLSEPEMRAWLEERYNR